MNKKALYFGLLYSLCFIIYKLVVLLGGYTLTKFGFYYSTVTGVLFILPFFFLAIYLVREKDYGGIIGGKESIRIALSILAVALVITSVYNYIEFEWKFKEIAIGYYNSPQYLDILKEQQLRYPAKIKIEDFPKIVKDQIAELSAFKSVTGKLIPFLFFGLGGAFMAAIMLKRKVR
jgi:hypothetical protein